MQQLVLPTLILLLAGALMVPVGLRLARYRTPWQACLLVLLVAAMLLIHILYLLDNLRLAQWLPIADCMLYTNLSIPLSALVVALAWPVLRLPAWQKLALLLFVVSLGLQRSYAPFVGPRPAMKAAMWHGDVCQQTTLSTCVPAACATLLAKVGIPATEQELARLCFTAESGSSSLAAYRALKIKTSATPYDAIAFVGSADELRRQPFVGGIISMGFDSGPKPLLPQNARHELAIWSFNDNRSVTLADPLSGNRLAWPAAEFDRSWPGQGVFLRHR